MTDLLSKQPIGGAIVSSAGAQAITDADGRYVLHLGPGTYEVHAAASGYIGMSSSRRVVRGGGVTALDLQMVVSAPSAQQWAALDAIFRQQVGPDLTSQGLAEMQDAGFRLSGVTHLPDGSAWLTPDGIVVVMTLDEYIKGVLPREMPPYWPREALKAQAVAARSYAASARRHAEAGADVCTTTHCQVWSRVHYETTDASGRQHAQCGRYLLWQHHQRLLLRPLRRADAQFRGSLGSRCALLSQRGLPLRVHQHAGARRGHVPGRSARPGSDRQRLHRHPDVLLSQHVQVASVPPPTLQDPALAPAAGDTATQFEYTVVYTSRDQPVVAHVYIDGHAYAMTSAGTSSSGGTVYRYSTYLATGEHSYAFHFEDGYSLPVTLPVSGTLSGPTVNAAQAPVPTPLPTLSGTQVEQWVQSTVADFALGTHAGTTTTQVSDGELALVPDRASGVYTSTIKSGMLQFVAIGTVYQGAAPAGTAITVALRSSSDGSTWSDWVDVPPMDAQREEPRLTYGELLYLPGRYAQYRVTLTRQGAGDQPGTVVVDAHLH